MTDAVSSVQRNGSYLSQVRLEASSLELEDVVASLDNIDARVTKVCFIDRTRPLSVQTPAQIIAAAAAEKATDSNPVCIIENISPEYIDALGTAWGLDPEFFINHASNPARKRLWAPHGMRDDDVHSSAWKAHGHIEGNFEYHGIHIDRDKDLNSSPNCFKRHCFRKVWDGVDTVNSNTRISYYRIQGLCRSPPIPKRSSSRSLTALDQICSSLMRRCICNIIIHVLLAGTGPL
jgi:hypothetical protein